jgi:hypothetical protein
MNPSQIESLFAKTLLGDYDAATPWEVGIALQNISIDAANEMPGMKDGVTGWKAGDYAMALRERFGL